MNWFGNGLDARWWWKASGVTLLLCSQVFGVNDRNFGSFRDRAVAVWFFGGNTWSGCCTHDMHSGARGADVREHIYHLGL